MFLNKDRNQKIVDLVKEKNVRTMILIKNIEHGELLRDWISGSIFLSGVDDPLYRKEIIDKFEDGKVDTIIATNIFNEGISINSIQMLIVASGGKSRIETIQRLGRALRVSKELNKKDVLVYDFNDTGNLFTERHAGFRKKTYKKFGFEVK